MLLTISAIYRAGRMLVVKAEIVQVISIGSYKSCNGKVTQTL